jgi:hypothetical protein
VATKFSQSVFINCPFDSDYQALFHSIVFAVQQCGLIPRCALEASDAGESRIERIQKIIETSKFGIHDLSRVEMSSIGLPRFNMPLELGLDMGCKRYGTGRQKNKVIAIFEKSEHRYDLTVSDISGQDIFVHGGEPFGAIKSVRDWLSRNGMDNLPGAAFMFSKYKAFQKQLPIQCKEFKLNHKELEFVDLTRMISKWLQRKA